nr:reverse transcriptase domain-containing protein [Tanacetum cinerariifolium]
MSAMANTTPIVTTVMKTATKEKTSNGAETASRINILDFCEEHYEDILPFMDKIRRDKRREVIKGKVHSNDLATFTRQTRLSPGRRNTLEMIPTTEVVLTNETLLLAEIVLEVETAPTALKNRRSSSMKKGRNSESPISGVLKSGTSEGGHWKSKSKGGKPIDEEDFALPWDREGMGAPSGDIDGYKDLKVAFLAYFMQHKKYVKDQVEIHNIKQKDGETIEDFIERFKIETRHIKGAPEIVQTTTAHEHYTRAWMNFMIVRSPSPYNGIIGRPGIREIQALPSTTHGMLKFLVNGGIVTIRSTILTPTKCTTIVATPKDHVKNVEARHKNFKVAIHPDFSDQEITIGGTISIKARTKLCTLLKRNLDIFAWQLSDMTGVPRSIAEHRLNIREGYSPVRQKKRGQASKRAKAIQVEVQKLVEAKILREVYYHNCLSNPVMVKNHDGSWMMCVDFTDLCTDPLLTERLCASHRGHHRPAHQASDVTSRCGRAIAKIERHGPTSPRKKIWSSTLSTKSLISGFANFFISQVPRSKNKKANTLSKIASTSFTHLSKHVLVEVLKEKSIQEEEVATVVEEEGPTWMTLIMEYLKDGTFPGDRKKASKLHIKARQYELLEGVLYRRMHTGPRSIVDKAMRLGYYWPTMHRDARDMIRMCNACQVHRPMPRNPQQPLTPITARWPFYKWGINITSPFSEGPGKSNGLVERANQSLGEGIKAQIRMPTYRTAVVDVVHNNEELRLNLDLLEERRECAAIREAKAKLKMTKYYNTSVRGVTFRPGDFVYRSNEANHAMDGRKLEPKWEGPYEVTEALGDRAYRLRSMGRAVLLRTWNIANLKIFYL